MNTQTIFDRFDPERPGETDLIVSLTLPDLAVLKGTWYPENNRIGTELLFRLLSAHITADGGVIVAEAHCRPFNQAFFLFRLDSHATLELAKGSVNAEMASLNLSEYCQLAWFLPSESVLVRQQLPSGNPLPALPTNEDLMIEVRLRDQIAELYRQTAARNTASDNRSP